MSRRKIWGEPASGELSTGGLFKSAFSGTLSSTPLITWTQTCRSTENTVNNIRASTLPRGTAWTNQSDLRKVANGWIRRILMMWYKSGIRARTTGMCGEVGARAFLAPQFSRGA